MRYKMRVVATKNIRDALFFSCDHMIFDVFFAQVLCWEDEQFMKVTKKGGAEETIRFFDPYGSVPECCFDHKGTRVDRLYAFQFNAGDCIEFTVRDTGGIGMDLATRLKDSYFRQYVATHIYDWEEYHNFSPQKQHVFTEALRADARAEIEENGGQLIFSPSEREWK